MSFCENTITVAGTVWNNNCCNNCSHSYISLFCILLLCSSVPHLQTVELSDCEKTQALALRVLLSLSKFNQHRIHEMDCYHGYSMIHQVLIKSKCIVGYHMLKVSHVLNSLLSSVPIAGLCSKTYSPEPDPAGRTGASVSQCWWPCCDLTLWLCL